MTAMRTIQDDVNALAMHVLDVADYASGVEAKAKDDLSEGLEKVRAEMQEAFDAKLEAFKKEIMGDVDSEASKAVADLGAKVAELGKAPAAKAGEPEPEEKPEPVVDLTPKPEATIPAPEITVGGDTTFHKADDGVVTVLDHTSGQVRAFTPTGEVVEAKPEAVTAVVQATVDAGVAVPEAAASDAGATPAPAVEPQPVIA